MIRRASRGLRADSFNAAHALDAAGSAVDGIAFGNEVQGEVLARAGRNSVVRAVNLDAIVKFELFLSGQIIERRLIYYANLQSMCAIISTIDYTFGNDECCIIIS